MLINFNAIRKLGARGILKLKDISPELALGAGIACGIGAIVTACMASRKVDKVIKETHEALDQAEKAMEEAETPEEVKKVKKETVDIWVGAAWKMVKLYGPTLFLAMASGGFILTSHGILKKRYLTTAAAYKALDEAYKAYRANVEQNLGYGAGEKAIAARARCENDISVENEDGSVEKKDGANLVHGEKKSPYEFDFNRYTSPLCWNVDPVQNEIFLRAEQNYVNDLLTSRGYVFLNEVLDRLGLERTSMGQLIGWYKGAGDDYIDFGYLDGYIRDWNTDSDLCKKNIRLNFNCDGIIYDMLRKKV